MRILYLVNSDRGDYRKLSRRLFFNIYRRISIYCRIYTYGPGEHTVNGNTVSPLKYDEKIEFDDLVKEFKPDIVVALKYPLTYRWMKSHRTSSIPFILIEGDYFATPLGWYEDNKFDLIIQRGYVHNEYTSIPNVWLPLSADEKDFCIDPYSNYLDNRKQKVVFIGNVSNFLYYKIRRNILGKLENNDLFENLGVVGFEDYPNKLMSYIAGLSCSGSSLHAPIGKTFEIMASGTALLTQWFHGWKVLFGNKKCYFTYKDDLSNLEDMVRYILNNMDEVKEVTSNAVSVINAKHLNMHRVLELYNIFKAIVSGKEIPRIWGR